MIEIILPYASSIFHLLSLQESVYPRADQDDMLNYKSRHVMLIYKLCDLCSLTYDIDPISSVDCILQKLIYFM